LRLRDQCSRLSVFFTLLKDKTAETGKFLLRLVGFGSPGSRIAQTNFRHSEILTADDGRPTTAEARQRSRKAKRNVTVMADPCVRQYSDASFDFALVELSLT
jgi:hypothetical protein